MEQIACKECTSPDCHGCNMYRLERMLMSGKLDALMDENRAIKTDADVRPVVTCAYCKHNNACLTQAFVEDASRVPFDRNTFFCADGKENEREGS